MTRFSGLLCVCLSAACATTTPTCPRMASAVVQPAVQPVQSVHHHAEELQPRCIVARPIVRPGQHLTAVRFTPSRSTPYMLGIGPRGVAPQAQHYCFVRVAEHEQTTVYFATIMVTEAVLINEHLEREDGSTNVRPDAVVLMDSLEIDDRPVATHVACHEFLGGIVACEHDVPRVDARAKATGAVAWKERSVGMGSVVYADDHLYLRGDSGAVALVEATPDQYREKGRFNQPDRSKRPARSYSVVTGGRLHLRDDDVLLCYGVSEKKGIG